MIKDICSIDVSKMAINKSTDAILLDVRSQDEWSQIGEPDIVSYKNLRLVKICIYNYPSHELSSSFINELEENNISKDADIFCLCRSGVRSLQAAKLIEKLGYKNIYNVVDGFEGNDIGDGWKYSGLPWKIN